MVVRILFFFLRFWRKFDDECLLENDVIVFQYEEYFFEVNEKCFVDRNVYYKMEELSCINIVDSVGDEFIIINLQEDMVCFLYLVIGEVFLIIEVILLVVKRVVFLGMILCVILFLFIFLVVLLIKFVESILSLEIIFICLML